MKELIRRINNELVIETESVWIKPDGDTKKRPFINHYEVMKIVSKVLHKWDRQGRPEGK